MVVAHSGRSSVWWGGSSGREGGEGGEVWGGVPETQRASPRAGERSFESRRTGLGGGGGHRALAGASVDGGGADSFREGEVRDRALLFRWDFGVPAEAALPMRHAPPSGKGDGAPRREGPLRPSFAVAQGQAERSGLGSPAPGETSSTEGCCHRLSFRLSFPRLRSERKVVENGKDTAANVRATFVVRGRKVSAPLSLPPVATCREAPPTLSSLLSVLPSASRRRN